MTAESPLTRRLDETDNTAGFDCGTNALNHYLRRHALANQMRGTGVTWVAEVPGKPSFIRGYYTLSASAIARKDLPGHWPYPDVPTVLLGKLARSTIEQPGFGRALLRDALLRVLEVAEHIGVGVVSLKAINQELLAYYASFGFECVDEADRIMVLSLATIRNARAREPGLFGAF